MHCLRRGVSYREYVVDPSTYYQPGVYRLEPKRPQLGMEITYHYLDQDTGEAACQSGTRQAADGAWLNKIILITALRRTCGKSINLIAAATTAGEISAVMHQP